jgi:Ni/Fe-hydrogenase subunit HybB-like protein
VLTLGSSNISERSLEIDNKVGWIITVIGIPSAFLLHGYVGFIFGSVKANPWWSSPLMPVVVHFLGHGVGHSGRHADLYSCVGLAASLST